MEDGKRGRRRSIVDVAPAGLEEAADEEDLEKSICILEKLERRAGLDKLVGESVKVVLRHRLDVLV